MKKTPHLLILTICIYLFSCTVDKQDKVNWIPLPQEVEFSGKSFTLDTSTGLYSLVPVEGHARELMENALGKSLDFTSGVNSKGIYLDIDSSRVKQTEGYFLEVNSERVLITGADQAGLYYGCLSFLQMLPLDFRPGEKARVPGVKIKDYPRFGWRGMHLDVSRHFFPKDSILRFIDYLAMYKLNVFHWHLTDDQGWRIEIEKYPGLTSTGAWREDTRDRPWDYRQYPVVEGKPVYGGYYTRDEIKEVVQYAADRHITIVPEIDVPGHSWAALLAFPHLSCTGKPFFLPDHIPFEFTDPFCAGNEETYRFLEDVFAEVMELFPSKYIHLGGDEAKKTPWEHCTKCQRLMRSEGLQNVEELQSYFIRRIGKFIQEKGRQYIGWDEILEGGLPEGAAVMSWRGEQGGLEAVRSGHPAVMVPGNVLYFNNYQHDPSLEGMAEGHVSTLEKVYAYDPVPGELSSEEARLVLGVQACLWTEHVQTWNRLQTQVFPRLLALSEIAWTVPGRKDIEGFRGRLPYHLERLWQQGIDFFLPPPAGLPTRIAVLQGEATQVNLTNPLGYGTILYNTGNEKITANSGIYSRALEIHSPTTLSAGILLPGGKLGTIASGTVEFLLPVPPVKDLAKDQLSTGTRFTYHELELTSLGQADWTKPKRHGVMDRVAIPDDNSGDHFAVVYSSYFMADEDDVYTFVAISDDGSRLFIHDSLVVDNDGVHAPQARSGKVALARGLHPLRIEYFEARYGEMLEVKVSSNKLGELDLERHLYFK